MGKCKNCGNDTKNNNVYCSYKCRNIYVNKNLRDYTKNINGLKKKEEKKKEEYYKNPNKCKNCGEIIEYENKNNVFCNSSCSASYTNKLRKGIKYNMSEEGLENLKKSAKKNFIITKNIEERKKYYSNIKRCLNCNKMLPYNKRHNVYCNIDCKKEYYDNNKTEYELYKKNCQFNFNLMDYEDEFDFSLVEKYGWYKAKNNGDNLGGVSRDHMISIKYGFDNKIDYNLISHPANCKLMIHNENVSKNSKSSITKEELIKRIKKFNNKYNNYKQG